MKGAHPAAAEQQSPISTRGQRDKRHRLGTARVVKHSGKEINGPGISGAHVGDGFHPKDESNSGTSVSLRTG
jgi:hypothetical protein